ncbi:MAG: Fic family protein [Deltaproteobacteria bacterium]|nr:Fic family protein [Deltaproteobacteria bacterium]
MDRVRAKQVRAKGGELTFFNSLLEEGAGEIRTDDVEILGSKHEPPPASQVTSLLQQMCDEVNASESDAIDLAAFVLWRVNWIHPFGEGNGRTARAASYLVLSVCLGRVLPGKKMIWEQLASEKRAYWKALEAADAACKAGASDVSVLADLIRDMLETQISS